jgi:transposase
VDLAKYCVDAVLIEGRSVRAVATATGRSKSWVQRHVALYREGGHDALAPHKRGPKVPANLTSAVLEDKIVAWRKRLGEVSRPGFDGHSGALIHAAPVGVVEEQYAPRL